ncbi:hypothetical protein [Parapedobacter sp. DT-150]|uniref:hypothetical protein n=1 Tax=Parapedobacter sp. DT-150 TaxID=3396162 RepID=UPI003F1A3B5B
MKTTFTYMIWYRIVVTIIAGALITGLTILCMPFWRIVIDPENSGKLLLMAWTIVVSLSLIATALIVYLIWIYSWRLKLYDDYFTVRSGPFQKQTINYATVGFVRFDSLGTFVYVIGYPYVKVHIPNFISDQHLIVTAIDRGYAANQLRNYQSTKIFSIVLKFIACPLMLFNSALAYPYRYTLPVTFCLVPLLLIAHWQWQKLRKFEHLFPVGTGIVPVYILTIVGLVAAIHHNFALHPDYMLFPFAFIPAALLSLVAKRFGIFDFRVTLLNSASVVFFVSLPIYCYCLLVSVNTLLDTAEPERRVATVTQLVGSNNTIVQPLATIIIWQDTEHPYGDISPTFPLFEKMQVGGQIELDVHRGWLDIPWYQRGYSIFNDGDIGIVAVKAEPQ